MKINLGSGSDIRPGWVNIDSSYGFNVPEGATFIDWDLRQGFPEKIPYEGVDIFYSSHFQEHLTPEDNIKLMTRCYKMLRPGGRFYTEIPDFVSSMKAYINKDWEYFNHPSILVFAPDKLLGQIWDYASHQRVNGHPEHISFIDEEIMLSWFKKAGFKDYKLSSYTEGISNPNPLRRKYSLYFEAVK